MLPFFPLFVGSPEARNFLSSSRPRSRTSFLYRCSFRTYPILFPKSLLANFQCIPTSRLGPLQSWLSYLPHCLGAEAFCCDPCHIEVKAPSSRARGQGLLDSGTPSTCFGPSGGHGSPARGVLPRVAQGGGHQRSGPEVRWRM